MLKNKSIVLFENWTLKLSSWYTRDKQNTTNHAILTLYKLALDQLRFCLRQPRSAVVDYSVRGSLYKSRCVEGESPSTEFTWLINVNNNRTGMQSDYCKWGTSYLRVLPPLDKARPSQAFASQRYDMKQVDEARPLYQTSSGLFFYLALALYWAIGQG